MFVFDANKPDGSSSLRIGQVVPSGDVNLAYIVTPDLDPAQNVQVVDCAGADIDNLTRFLNMDNLAVADLDGQLHYLTDNTLDQTPMPTQNLVLTSVFYDNQLDVADALYYQYTVMHGDFPGLSGLYTGDSIVVTDASGNVIDPVIMPYEINLTPMPTFGVYTAVISASFTTDSETYMVRYNKASGSTIIPGYTETFNATPIYVLENSMSNILGATSSDQIYAVTDVANGYDVYVPEVAQYDPRLWEDFSWQLTAKDANNNAYTTGLISDRILPSTCLLTQEQGDYNTDGSRILTVDGLSVSAMLKLLSGANLTDIVFESNGNSTVTIPTNNIAEAVTTANAVKWPAPAGNTMYVDQGIDYCCTVSPQQNITSLSWNWSANGSGVISNAPTNGDGNFTTMLTKYASLTQNTGGSTNTFTTAANTTGSLTVYNIPGRSSATESGVSVLLSNYADSNYPADYNVLCLDTGADVTLLESQGMPAANATITFAVYVASAATINIGFAHSNQLTIKLNGVQQYQSLTDDVVPNSSFLSGLPLAFQPGWNDLEFDYLDTNLTGTAQAAMINGIPVRCNNSYIYLNESLTSYLAATDISYKINSTMPTITPWTTTTAGSYTALATWSGTAWSIVLSPNDLPAGPASPPVGLQNFVWTSLNWTEQDVTMTITGNQVSASISIPGAQTVGQPCTFQGTIHKSDGVVNIASMATIQAQCGLTSLTSEELANVYLQISPGDIRDDSPTPDVNFRWLNNGLWQSPGNNTVSYSAISSTGQLIAWTNMQSLLGAPTFAVQCNQASSSYEQVFVTVPGVADPNLDNWYMSVQNGVFESNVYLPPGNYEACPELENYVGDPLPVILHYALPEYAWQNFSPQLPYLTVAGGDAARIDDNNLQLPNVPLSSVASIILNPTAPNAITCTVTNVNNATGVVTVTQTIHDNDVISATYTYSTTSYEYRGYTSFDQFWHLDLNPSPGHQFSAITDGTTYIIPGDFPSINTGQAQDVDSSNLLQLCIYVYMRPTASVYDGVLIPGSNHQTTVLHTTEAQYFDPTSIFYDPSVLLLARVYVRPGSAPGDVTVVDTRTRGGGLKPGYTDSNLWDIGLLNGVAYPENGIIIARFPRSILQANGGQFTETDVQNAVNRFLAYGVYAEIEYFDD